MKPLTINIKRTTFAMFKDNHKRLNRFRFYSLFLLCEFMAFLVVVDMPWPFYLAGLAIGVLWPKICFHVGEREERFQFHKLMIMNDMVYVHEPSLRAALDEAGVELVLAKDKPNIEVN